ncbi:hypothetical protein HK104_002945 [Borealophlyctis nickersoniae]|nr:hypothetical protein HK104_002945 [Borealophlyctis nickersoniae]
MTPSAVKMRGLILLLVANAVPTTVLAGPVPKADAAADAAPKIITQELLTNKYPVPVGSAKTFLKKMDKILSAATTESSEAQWAYETNITDANLEKSTDASVKFNKILTDLIAEGATYKGNTADEKRQLELLHLMGGVPKSADDQRKLATLVGEMTGIYSTGKVDGKPLDPDLTEILATSRDYQQLQDAYLGWRKAVGPEIKPLYEQFANVSNVGARDGGWPDTGVLWRSGYDMPVADFTDMVEKVWQQVLPLYEQLHCYVKGKLAEKYGKDKVELEGGYMPAHLLGNMWSQDWSNIYDLVIPYPEELAIDITPALKEQGYDAVRMHKLAESFWTSLGYDNLPKSFWKKSMLVRPADREVVCHASAWDFGNDDLRIKMCTSVNGDDLYTCHHEQGHLYYDHYYRHQPAIYRDAAADFFHEAIGDTVLLSLTPAHLSKIGLIKGNLTASYKLTVNAQMKEALSKIAILPWALLVDKWRWGVFAGEIKPEQYQDAWVALVEKYQGLKRPAPSAPGDFDPGAKFHVPNNTPYARYFLAAALQFQFHSGLCAAAGHKGPLHECSIYGSRAAGAQFKKMLAMGRSEVWQNAIKVGTAGKYTEVDGGAIREWFGVLEEWVREQNKGRTCGWVKE